MVVHTSLAIKTRTSGIIPSMRIQEAVDREVLYDIRVDMASDQLKQLLYETAASTFNEIYLMTKSAAQKNDSRYIREQ